MAFPVLSTTPLVDGYEDGLQDGSTIESPKEAGYVQTRPRFTREREQRHVIYSGLTAADVALLKAHQATVHIAADSFSWTDPFTATVYTMRYGGPIKFKPENKFDDVGAHTWSAEFDLKQV